MTAHPWQGYAAALRKSVPYRRLAEQGGDAMGLPLPAAAWVGSLLAEDLGRPLVALVPREADALAWIEAAELFGQSGDAVYFPAPSLTPYQEADPSLLVRVQEAVALDSVLAGAARILVCTPRALFRKLPTRAAFGDGALELARGVV